jgi:hypothetical protein
LNFGKEFWAKYDRRHDLSVVGIYRLSPRITLSGTWIYGTGNALTIPQASFQGKVFNPGIPVESGLNYGYFGSSNRPNYAFSQSFFREQPDYGERNNFRAESYHRLDLGIQFHKKMKKGHERTWDISFYNVYARKNPFFYSLTRQERTDPITQQTTVTKNLARFSLFGFIIPSFSYSFKF